MIELLCLIAFHSPRIAFVLLCNVASFVVVGVSQRVWTSLLGENL